jgi:hypothetical protein
VIGRFFPAFDDLIVGNSCHSNPVQLISVAGPSKLNQAGLDFFPGQNVHAPFIVGEHPMPALIIGAVSENVFSFMSAPAVPTFNQQTFVQLQMKDAGGVRR